LHRQLCSVCESVQCVCSTRAARARVILHTWAPHVALLPCCWCCCCHLQVHEKMAKLERKQQKGPEALDK
jgi:hypothetical protein